MSPYLVTAAGTHSQRQELGAGGAGRGPGNQALGVSQQPTGPAEELWGWRAEGEGEVRAGGVHGQPPLGVDLLSMP